MAKDTTKGRAQDFLKSEDYSKIGIEALSRNLTKSRSIVSLKFKADADFFCPDNKGREWLSTAGKEGGGKASIVILCSSSNEEDAIPVPIVRWHSYIGQDGLNCRILSGLPIHRGSAGEFFFKSASTTSNGVSRKTVFALKFSNKIDADEFHMWWLHFNGQIHAWTDAVQQHQDPTLLSEDCPSGLLSNLVKIKSEVFDSKKNTKRKLSLQSPPAVSGVGKQFTFQSPESKPPAKQRTKFEQVNSKPLPCGFRSLQSKFHVDRLLFKAELLTQLLSCLRNLDINFNGIHIALDKSNNTDKSMDSSFIQIDMSQDDPIHRKFNALISNVPQEICGYLWSAADDAARSSHIEAVQKEQALIDRVIDDLSEGEDFEAAIENLSLFCLPSIKIKPEGYEEPIDRSNFCHPAAGSNSAQALSYASPSSVSSGEEVLVDEGPVVMSQEMQWY